MRIKFEVKLIPEERHRILNRIFLKRESVLNTWQRQTMSDCVANISTTLPLPSSPHWAPKTTHALLQFCCEMWAELPFVTATELISLFRLGSIEKDSDSSVWTTNGSSLKSETMISMIWRTNCLMFLVLKVVPKYQSVAKHMIVKTILAQMPHI